MALTKVSTGVVDMSQDTGGLIIAKGTTAQQPTCTAANLGSIRENTTENKVEVCTANAGTPGWQFLEEVGPTFIPLTVEYLVVAGGGGGGNYDGGGGGAGGYLTNFQGTALVLQSSTPYDISVGDGGTGGTKNSLAATVGGNSQFSNIISYGGGAGRNDNNSPNAQDDGGSGGGGDGGSGGAGGSATPAGQGNNEGSNSGNFGGGGGGAGQPGNTNGQGTGGDGLQNAITGSNIYYAGGGGGDYRSGGAAGGLGGGGLGNGTNGTNYLGAGGGSEYSSGGQGGYGGYGVVILRYPNNYTVNKSVGLTSSVSISVAGYKIETFFSGTGTITFA
jgi:hypothetical protein